MKLQIVAVANERPKHDYLVRGWEALNNSCRRHGFEPVILGWGQKWRGLGSKPKLLKKAIEDGTVSAEHILFVDAYDVWFSDSPARILDIYLAEFADKYRIVWNAEKNCFPDADWAQHHPKTDSPFKYYNSGMSIGGTRAYHAIFTQIGVESWPDDYQDSSGRWHHVNDQQYGMAKFLFGQCGPDEPKMALDVDSRMFQTLVGVESLDELEGRNAVGWHANGPAKTFGLMEKLLAKHGL